MEFNMNDSVVKYHFPSIDILRFFAAVSVVIYHCIEHFSWDLFPTKYGMLWFRMGWMGVDIFFVISGFVISLAAFSQIDRHGNAAFSINFMKKRLARIVPLHYLTLLVFIIFISPSLIHSGFIYNLLSHLFFVHNLSYITHGDMNGVNWSLGAEMQFYVIVALVAPYIKNCNVFKVILPALVITYCWRFFAFQHSSTETPEDTFHFFVWATQLPGMLDEFLIGYLVARFVRSDYGVKLFSYRFSPLILLVIFSTLAYVLFYIYLQKSAFWPYPYMVIFFRTYMALTFGALIIFLCSLRIKKTVRMLLTPLYYGGTISYGIYLWHLPVLLTVKEKLPWLNHAQSLIVIIAFTLVLSSLSWHFFEKRFLAKKI